MQRAPLLAALCLTACGGNASDQVTLDLGECSSPDTTMTMTIRQWQSDDVPDDLSVAVCRQLESEQCALAHGDSYPPGVDLDAFEDSTELGAVEALPSTSEQATFSLPPQADGMFLAIGSATGMPAMVYLERELCGVVSTNTARLPTWAEFDDIAERSGVAGLNRAALAVRPLACDGTPSGESTVTVEQEGVTALPALDPIAEGGQTFFVSDAADVQVLIDGRTYDVPVRAGQVSIFDVQQPGCD